jgi:membrane protease YdiL (CAAX protease family)
LIEFVAVSRWFAAIQIFLVSGLPTGLLIAGALYLAGYPMTAEGAIATADTAKISFQYFAMTGLLDTALIAILIRIFLVISGESSAELFLGRRRPAGEVLRGLALIPLLLVGVIAVTAAISRWLPSLHNVQTNPLERYMDSPFKAGVFLIVVILAGGVREEIQRAFVLHRFEQSLGGANVGLVVWSVAFALLHVPQGFDAAIAVGCLGLLWGVIYLRRRSAIIPMVSHAGFDVLEVLQQLLVRTL